MEKHVVIQHVEFAVVQPVLPVLEVHLSVAQARSNHQESIVIPMAHLVLSNQALDRQLPQHQLQKQLQLVQRAQLLSADLIQLVVMVFFILMALLVVILVVEYAEAQVVQVVLEELRTVVLVPFSLLEDHVAQIVPHAF
jgi:hypothetical protein